MRYTTSISYRNVLDLQQRPQRNLITFGGGWSSLSSNILSKVRHNTPEKELGRQRFHDG